MLFQLSEVTKVAVTNTNPRREFHGEEKVRAIDISMCVSGENTLLDLIEDGLRAHHYYNREALAGQDTFPTVTVPLPNLRFPRLPLTYHYAKGEKWRGYRLVRDFGLEDESFDFDDVVISSIHYELADGGSCKVFFTISYNGDELTDNDLYGRLSGLASEGDIHIKLLAPAGVVPVKKGYRAGKPDTPSTEPEDGAQQSLEGAAGGEEPAAGSPEAAFIASSLDDKVKVTREPEPTGKVHTLRKKA